MSTIKRDFRQNVKFRITFGVDLCFFFSAKTTHFIIIFSSHVKNQHMPNAKVRQK